MDTDSLNDLLGRVARGETSPDEAARALARLPFADLGDVKVDHHRALRCGFPEVVFCEGKTPQQVRSAAREVLEHSPVLLGTRASASHYQHVAQAVPDARYFEEARVILVDRRAEPPREGHIVVATGGTSDSRVAEEAVICAEAMGNRVTRLYDVGVAGVHRLLAHEEVLRDARVVVAIAGMEGALPSVVAGLVACPVVAVPTSVGYGAAFGGIAALLAMLNSCANGVGVVNIDNGFGAAALASRINRGAPAEADIAP
ncbi:MAG: 1-(5-phosphoribosyl)-5-amino-4-imidazole-carboxylate carboxylase [Coriobacteriaceae bacterium]|nr:1-(5-phosphoribosyl)-5-amino-4-imidazole-carboxylate carboxylase [Coriobacteriaceae bacterium]